jgi:PAS domain S-box-containing protein
MTQQHSKETSKQNMSIFKPAIALMNWLKYPQKFFLISLLFMLPLALVMILLLSEINSRIEFTQKEIYGNAYLRSVNQLWRYIPRRQLILERQFYANSQNADQSLPPQSQELQDFQNKIDQEFTLLSKVDSQLGGLMQTGDKLKQVKLVWQSLRNNSKEVSALRSHDLLMEQLDYFRIHIVDFSNLILDPDLDTYYLMDAIANKLPEMQRLLHKLMQTEAEVVFNKELTNNNRELLISLVSLLKNNNNQIETNLERSFKNNPYGNLRNSLGIPLRNFVVSISEINDYTHQLVRNNDRVPFTGSFYQQEMESTLEDSFTLWQQIIDRLDELLNYRIQGFAQRKQFILVFVLVIFIAIIYLFIGFYLSVMRTVHQLDIASKQMTVGGAISINLDSKDELSMVVRSFNNVAIALRESEEKYRSIFENSVDGIFQTTVDGKYINVNLALAEIYGYRSVAQMLEEIVDIQSQLYVDSDRRQQFQSLIEANDIVTGFESQIYRRDRSTIWISENVRAIRNNEGKIICYEGTVEDISQRKIAEIALEKANQQIVTLNTQLQEENMRMSSELEVTRKLQQMILPKDKELALILGLDIAGFMEPAAEVGGDYYDVLQQNGRSDIPDTHFFCKQKIEYGLPLSFAEA